jgi:hypothetical protein
VDEIKFICKCFLATLLLIAFMQIKIGPKTIESRAYSILAESPLASFLNDVASGSVKLAQRTKQQLESQWQKP